MGNKLFSGVLLVLPLLMIASCTFQDSTKAQLFSQLNTSVIDYTLNSSQALLLGGTSIQMRELVTVQNGKVIELKIASTSQITGQAEFKCRQIFKNQTWQECTCSYKSLVDPLARPTLYNCKKDRAQACNQVWYGCHQTPLSPDQVRKQNWLQSFENATFTVTTQLDPLRNATCYALQNISHPLSNNSIPSVLCFNSNQLLVRTELYKQTYFAQP